MNTTIRNTALASILFAAASGAAFAADTADLTVKGVIKPAACTPSFAGGGILDFGTISASTLSATAATALPAKDITLTVSCDAATKFGIETKDNQSGSANSTAGTAIVTSSSAWFGAGKVGENKIGAVVISRGSSVNAVATGDGQTVDPLDADYGSQTWFATPTLDYMRADGARVQSWGAVGTTTPGAYKTVTQPMRVQLSIGKISELPALTTEVPINGSITFSVKYL